MSQIIYINVKKYTIIPEPVFFLIKLLIAEYHDLIP